VDRKPDDLPCKRVELSASTEIEEDEGETILEDKENDLNT